MMQMICQVGTHKMSEDAWQTEIGKPVALIGSGEEAKERARNRREATMKSSAKRNYFGGEKEGYHDTFS